jgi:hypothetical protein
MHTWRPEPCRLTSGSCPAVTRFRFDAVARQALERDRLVRRAVFEQAVGVGLARVIDDLEPVRWISGDTIGYSRTSTGNEVDLAPAPLLMMVLG